MAIKPKTQTAFSTQELEHAHLLLASAVTGMMGRKLEEADWTQVYCAAKAIPYRGWSNLHIDVNHEGLGVEHKMLSSQVASLQSLCGTTLMHPSLTRSIRIDVSMSPDRAMESVFAQYAEFIEQRRMSVQRAAPDQVPELRTGWLIWQISLREFLYFEEELLVPEARDYTAIWQESARDAGGRKRSKNLWVFDKETHTKRYSITTSAGAKIQPYFDVPAPNDPNLYHFRVQGEEIQPGIIRIWVSTMTQRELKRLVGELSLESLSGLILTQSMPNNEGEQSSKPGDLAVPLLISAEAYQYLKTTFPGVNDEHMMRQLVSHSTPR